MSGIWMPDSTRSLVPLHAGHLTAAVTRQETSGELVSFPSLTADGSDVRGQVINARRPISDNYGGAAIFYVPNAARKSSITYYYSSTGMLLHKNPVNIAAVDFGADLIVFGPACTSHDIKQYGAVESYSYTRNGTVSGDSSTDNHYADQYIFSAEVNNPATFYVTFHYLITTTITNGGSYTDPIKIRTGTTAVESGAVGGIYVSQSSNRYSKSFNNLISDITNNTTPFTCTRFCDNNALPSTSPSHGNMKAYLRYDMHSRGPTIYFHHILCPYVSADISGFNYNSSYPNAELKFELEYSALVYRVPDGGWIWNNDDTLPDTQSITLSLSPRDEPYILMTVSGYQLVAQVSINAVNLKIRPYSSTGNPFTISYCQVEKRQTGGTSPSAISWAGTDTYYNQSASYSSPFSFVMFTNYVLVDSCTCNVETYMRVSIGSKMVYIRIWIVKTATCTLHINMSATLQ